MQASVSDQMVTITNSFIPSRLIFILKYDDEVEIERYTISSAAIEGFDDYLYLWKCVIICEKLYMIINTI